MVTGYKFNKYEIRNMHGVFLFLLHPVLFGRRSSVSLYNSKKLGCWKRTVKLECVQCLIKSYKLTQKIHQMFAKQDLYSILASRQLLKKELNKLR